MKKLEEFVISEDTPITEELTYDKVIEKLQEAKENNIPLDEGIIGAVVGGLAGATFGPKVMKAICKALGINETGPLGNLMTSRLVLTAVGTSVGWK